MGSEMCIRDSFILSYGDPYHLSVTRLQLFAVLAVGGAVPPHGGTGVLLGVLGAAMEIFTTQKLLMPPVIRIPSTCRHKCRSAPMKTHREHPAAAFRCAGRGRGGTPHRGTAQAVPWNFRGRCMGTPPPRDRWPARRAHIDPLDRPYDAR